VTPVEERRPRFVIPLLVPDPWLADHADAASLAPTGPA
jgi:hypothetical protein